jgi:hypothetical protein
VPPSKQWDAAALVSVVLSFGLYMASSLYVNTCIQKVQIQTKFKALHVPAALVPVQFISQCHHLYHFHTYSHLPRLHYGTQP